MDELNIDGIKFKETITPPEQNDIMVVGVGGGGGNAVNYMYKQGVENVTFLVLNTDKMAVENSPVPNKVIIGDGRGAGNKPEKAREFAEEAIEQINAIFDNKPRMVFITAGMGGGTGTGAAPVVARVARERGLLTIGIVTIPFVFEGKRKILKAIEGADEMSKYVDALLIINNERLAEIYPDLNFFNAFGKADDTLCTAARSITELITVNGYWNLDFNDVETTLRDGGTAVISTGYGEGEHRVTKAIEDALNSPLLKNRDIFSSKKLLINLYMAGEAGSPMVMSEVAELTNFVSGISSDVDVITGVAVDDSLGDQVKITILASGFDVTIREESLPAANTTEAKPTGTGKGKKGAKTAATPEPPRKTSDKILEEEYGTAINELGTNYIILTREQMDDDAVMEVLEKSPAYNRDKITVDRVKKGEIASALERTGSPAAKQNPNNNGQLISF